MTDSARTYVVQEVGAGASVCGAVRLTYFYAGAYIACVRRGWTMYLEAVSDTHETQAYLCMLSVSVCKYIQRKLYSLQQISQCIILLQVFLVW